MAVESVYRIFQTSVCCALPSGMQHYSKSTHLNWFKCYLSQGSFKSFWKRNSIFYWGAWAFHLLGQFIVLFIHLQAPKDRRPLQWTPLHPISNVQYLTVWNIIHLHFILSNFPLQIYWIFIVIWLTFKIICSSRLEGGIKPSQNMNTCVNQTLSSWYTIGDPFRDHKKWTYTKLSPIDHRNEYSDWIWPINS